MGKLIKIYKRNIYGVIGTLVFHILLFTTFLLADIDMKGSVRNDEIFIEFPDILPEPEEITQEEMEEEQEVSNDASQPNMQANQQRTNVASNQTATRDEFFDEDYQKQLEAAQKMVSDVNKQLSKSTVELEDIKMPVESTEGMDPDSIKNVIYSGESNISYFLENRYHIRLPIPVYLTQNGGKVIVDIIVNRQGQVTDAVARKNPAINNDQIYQYAEFAASKTLFNEDNSAPRQQKGTIHYTFIAQ